ncbi:helix-turn-helix domain-containing protein [Neobacillus cucumis]|uniref:helix-turn-helix domain-containing protein n=1 Tax=Neobacillus cucumis TaxID=1740721 RepID=UPI0019664260|nr:helix-turn-helix transcriptional regulator [Neobacillus cucumis]MBM7655872.1 transcriptional regulator with XRE-family HTH domain [Neobacillus cucumis]
MINVRKVKELRKKKGDTLKELAQKINYDFSNLSKIERGILQPSLPLIRKIADVYDVNLNYFLDLYSKEEEEFLNYLDLNSTNILEDYRLYLDDIELTEQELELAIEIIRKLRISINKKN